MKNFEKIHRVLANPVRRDILKWLKDPAKYFPKREPILGDGISAGMIQARTRLAQSTVSAHLAALHGADLLNMKRVGQWVFFSRNEYTIQLFLRQLARELA